MLNQTRTVMIAALSASVLGAAACGDRQEAAGLSSNETVTTQNAADAVAADLTEDVRDLTNSAAGELREGAAEAGQGLERAGDRLQNTAEPSQMRPAR